MENLKMYCVTNKEVSFLHKTSYDIGWVGLDAPPPNYITCNHQDNIFLKEQFYSELLGDLNDDQIVNVLDVILLVNMILDLSPLQFNSDINGDGNVDVLDVIIIVNIIIQTL